MPLSSNSHRPAIAPERKNQKALILPGGGMRVAYQAGIVKALHDHGLRYSYADGASGGTMNLAALLGGIDPDDLCSRWRTLRVRDFISLRSPGKYLQFPETGALGDFDGIEKCIFPHLGIDAAKIARSEGVAATFNVCNFDEKTVHAIAQKDISHELLLAGISLPIATPPVEYDGQSWTDAVWIRDCNLMAAVKAGANELWVAWCIGNTPDFKDGLLEQYVHMIEMSAVGKLNEELAEIAQINAAIAAGERPFGHTKPIVVHIIHPEIALPLDPDLLSGKIDAASLISYGYRDASRFLEHRKPSGSPLTPAATQMREPGPGVTFREVMHGKMTMGESDPDKGYANPAAFPLALHGTINVDDINAFVVDPNHYGDLNGHIEMHRVGGWFPSARGVFGLFTPAKDDSKLHYMVYAMQLHINGEDYWFNGRKHVRVAGLWRLWPATTTLYVTLHRGKDEAGEIVAAGRLHLGIAALMSLLSTFRATGNAGWWRKFGQAMKFFRFFVFELARIYIYRRGHGR